MIQSVTIDTSELEKVFKTTVSDVKMILIVFLKVLKPVGSPERS